MIIEIRVDMKSTRIEIYQIRIIASVSFVLVEQSHFRRRFFMIAHKFSIGFKSGELPGQPRTISLAFWKNFAFFWRCGKCCWKMPLSTGNDFFIDGINFLANISWYLT